MLAGLPTHIYQTVHDGALAFLVVVSSSYKGEERSANKSENAKLSVKSPRLDMAEVFSNAAEQLTDQSRFGITLH
jgi:ADP-ribosylglycohydrolase